ncbi:Gfo/Idh/MocA family protein [Limnochorda pilosa]|uniref:Oxidoreductase n=1 Tax=Limnochorda pilosa TaxID=1555112 RepID=A0A0K2SI78_LIMPI|nr:Gfo/Idh/MocA family oxidoreductase [Limnochorda pilosa]BAS26549.1 oxidoreductase [Limnochorda pilosa]
MQKLRVGIVGTGMAFEKLHLPAYRKLQDRFEITALCDADRFKAERWAGNLGLAASAVEDDAVALARRPDVDVVDIMVPIEANYPVTEAVASVIAGTRKAILAEKPLAATPDQLDGARTLAQRFDVPILVAENYRYSEEMDRIRDLVRQERVGPAVYFIQNRVSDFPARMWANHFAGRDWRQHPDFPGGQILDTALHDLAGLRHVFGPIHQVQAFGVPQDDDFSPYAVLQANLLFTSGLTGHFTFFGAGKETQRPLIGLRIFGTHGEIFLEERWAGTINVAHYDGTSEQIPYEPAKGYTNELLNLHKALTGQEAISVPPELEVGDVATVFALIRSARERRVVTLDEARVYQPA